MTTIIVTTETSVDQRSSWIHGDLVAPHCRHNDRRR
jgi:hypothetical protein